MEVKLEEAKKMLADPGMEEIVKEEIENIKNQIENINFAASNQEYGISGKDTDEQNFNSVIMEVRPGVGGDEAKIWAEDLQRMYDRYAEFNNFSVEQLDSGIMKIKGKNVFNIFKWETGVHRVQRVPETEAQGRIHTSTASVVVLPEVPDTKIVIKDDDLIWQFVTGGGHGGQNVNKVATAVRLTHKPTGIMISCRQERSQEQNRKIALSLLRSQLWELEEEKKRQDTRSQRLAIGRSMRAEKIRTYNYPQNRVTDHRIGKSWHKLDKIIEGNLGDVLNEVQKLELPQ